MIQAVCVVRQTVKRSGAVDGGGARGCGGGAAAGCCSRCDDKTLPLVPGILPTAVRALGRVRGNAAEP